MWVMLGEMFPNQIRGSGLAIAGLFVARYIYETKCNELEDMQG